MKSAFEDAWYFLKQYDPMQPTHIQSQVFPQMSSRTKIMMVPGGKLNSLGEETGYGGHSLQDVDEPFETSPAKTRLLMPDEQQERILADRDQAIRRANQFHQDRIDAMKVLPDVDNSFSQGGPEFNPFQPPKINEPTNVVRNMLTTIRENDPRLKEKVEEYKRKLAAIQESLRGLSRAQRGF